jgi:hypothetical protein
MKKVNAAECREIIKNNPYVVVKFSMEGCGPCITLSKTINAMHYAFPNIRFLEIDAVADSEYAIEFGFQTVPHLFFAAHGSFLKDSKGVFRRLKGAADASILREEFTRLQNILVSDNQPV